jgi:hypothetical protein
MTIQRACFLGGRLGLTCERGRIPMDETRTLSAGNVKPLRLTAWKA